MKFSVIIPYYKKRAYIERCVDSVLAQSYKNFEIILVDDGSGDEIAQFITDKYFKKVQLIQQENQGVSAARNTGIKNASSAYICFLDADDSWSPIYLESIERIIINNLDLKIIGTKYTRHINQLETEIENLKYRLIPNYFRKQAIENTLFSSSSTTIRADFFLNNTFNIFLKRGEDIDVWLRAVASGGQAVYVENTLVYYSEEDNLQATRSIAKVEHSLVGQINSLYQPLVETTKDLYFKKFISKYVYFNLYPYYFSDVNRKLAKQSLKQNHNFYFFLHLPYYIPMFLGKKIIKNETLNRYLRLYFKFFLRKIYL